MKNRNTRVIITCLCCLFIMYTCTSCKTPKSSVSNLQVSEKKDVKSDVSIHEALSIEEAVQRSIEKLKSGKYEIVINHIEYDTEKPAGEVTGKPPAKSETKTTITAQEDSRQTENTTVDKSGIATSELQDKSKNNTKTEVSEVTETKQGLSTKQIILMCLGGVAILVFITWLLKKLNVWKRLF